MRSVQFGQGTAVEVRNGGLRMGQLRSVPLRQLRLGGVRIGASRSGWVAIGSYDGEW